uniref:Uncharacterized protein n=1 Tax=Cacopsylla melanoneura TaxID=428564 RepID=A0A8D8YEV2_9HEMI
MTVQPQPSMAKFTTVAQPSLTLPMTVQPQPSMTKFTTVTQPSLTLPMNVQPQPSMPKFTTVAQPSMADIGSKEKRNTVLSATKLLNVYNLVPTTISWSV